MKLYKPIIRTNKYQIVKKFAWWPHSYIDKNDIKYTIWLETIYVIRQKDRIYEDFYFKNKVKWVNFFDDSDVEFICNHNVANDVDMIKFNKNLKSGNYQDLKLTFDIILNDK